MPDLYFFISELKPIIVSGQTDLCLTRLKYPTTTTQIRILHSVVIQKRMQLDLKLKN